VYNDYINQTKGLHNMTTATEEYSTILDAINNNEHMPVELKWEMIGNFEEAYLYSHAALCNNLTSAILLRA
jgi:hypothetical protein